MQDRVPAVVHKDGTGRLQTVDRMHCSWFVDMLEAWKDKSGCPILLNTSFNDREPIVETPQDAIDCFEKTDIDALYFFDSKKLILK